MCTEQLRGLNLTFQTDRTFCTTSSLQRYLNVGYARAARMIDELEKMGIVSGYNGAKPRKVLMTKQQYEERKMRNLP